MAKVQRNLAITRFDLAKRVLVLLGVLGFALLSLKVTQSSPRTGWSGVALLGFITVVASVGRVKQRKNKKVKREKTFERRLPMSEQ